MAGAEAFCNDVDLGPPFPLDLDDGDLLVDVSDYNSSSDSEVEEFSRESAEHVYGTVNGEFYI